MSAQIFTLPDVGEGLTEAEIISWKVAEGDDVSLNQVVVEIETAKSLVELPSPYSGKMARILVDEGQTIPVGTPIYEISADGTSASGPREPAVQGDDEPVMKPLVGTGPMAETVTRRARRTPAAPASGDSVSSAVPMPTPVPVPSPDASAAPSEPQPTTTPQRDSRSLAKPPVRKAAREAGIDLADCPATGQHGEVTRKDLEEYLSQRGAAAAAPSSSSAVQPGAGPAKASGGFSGEIERIPVKGVRKMTASAMVSSAFTAPHVSIFKEIDATATMELVQRLKKRSDFEGIKVSPLLVVAKACIYALERNRNVNSSWTEEEILVKHFVNLGIAAATPRGLVVPNIKNAHALSLRELAEEINELTATARNGKTQPADMQQGTFTITNVGSLGVDTGTPIINPGEVGILAFGSIRQKPWVVDGQIVPRWVTTVGGSFDHRIVDGDLAARFIVDVANVLEDPTHLL